jgi:hypothetical protein
MIKLSLCHSVMPFFLVEAGAVIRNYKYSETRQQMEASAEPHV